MAEEDDGSVTFTHYNNRDDLEVYINDEQGERPPEMADIDPATVYKNLDLFDDLILDAASRHGVSPSLVKAVMLVESGFNPRALSPKGAQGLMQLMPGTARELGVADAFDPAQNIAGGTAYLRRMIDRFGGNMDKAVAAYNAGPGQVEKYGGTPPIAETQFFVRNVTRFFDYFASERPVGSRP
jgi:soluble lytic murein transglycosylase-like protein